MNLYYQYLSVVDCHQHGTHFKPFHDFHAISTFGNHNWLVVYLPLWKIWVRQLGWWTSQLNGKIRVMLQSPPTRYLSLYPNKSPYFPSGFSYDFHVPVTTNQIIQTPISWAGVPQGLKHWPARSQWPCWPGTDEDWRYLLPTIYIYIYIYRYISIYKVYVRPM